MKKILISLSIIFVLLSCGKVDEKTKTKLEKLKSKVSSNQLIYSQQVKNYKETIKINYLEKKSINDKNKLFLSLKLLEYIEKNKKLPEKTNQFIKYLDRIPKEIFTSSSRISFKKDLKGGWYINLKSKKIKINYDKSLLEVGK